MTRSEKLTIAQGICAPLLRKIRADLQRNVDPNSGYDGSGAGNETGDNENDTQTLKISTSDHHEKDSQYITSEGIVLR